MMKRVLYFAFLCGVSPLASAAEFYAAPHGRMGASGSITDPLDLRSALAAATCPAEPGDTIWLRGGVYQGPVEAYHYGASGRPVTIRQYPGERARIDGAASPSTPTLYIYGLWTVWRDIEVMNSSVNRAPGTGRPAGIYVSGPNTRLINCIVHDAGLGIGFWSGAVDSEMYGCLIYNTGFEKADGEGNGHSVYSANDTGTKSIHDNILCNSFGFGFNIYTEGGQIRGFNLQGNISFNAGASSASDHRYSNLFIGGHPPAARIVVVSNYTYTAPGADGSGARLSYGQPDNEDLVCTDNTFVGGDIAFQARNWHTVTLARNVIYTTPSQTLVWGGPFNVFSPGSSWDHNTYFGTGARSFLAGDGTGNYMDFAGWKTYSGREASSTASAGAPTGVKVFVRPNKYEARRAHVAVYNWDQLDRVNVDLAGVLRPGDRFEVRNAQNYFGPPVASGTYGGGTISLPTTNLVAAAPAGMASSNVRPDARFNAYVVLGQAGAPVPNAPPTVSDVPDQTLPVNQATTDLAFIVGDSETDAASLAVTAASSNPSLVPGAGIVLGGGGANRIVRVTPATGATGSAVITLTVADGQGATAQSEFAVTVNAPPTPSVPPPGANQYFAAPVRAMDNTSGGPLGTPAGNGSQTSPWDLRTAFNKGASLPANSTLWLRGGRYPGRFVSNLQGVTVRSYPGEWAVIDGFNKTSLGAPLTATSTTISFASAEEAKNFGEGDIVYLPDLDAVPLFAGSSLPGDYVWDTVRLGARVNATTFGINLHPVTPPYTRSGVPAPPGFGFMGDFSSLMTRGATSHPAGRTVYLGSGGQAIVTINGSDTVYRNFELNNTLTDRTALNKPLRNQLPLLGMNVYGPRCKVVNLVLRNTAALGFWVQAVDSEAYGNLIYNQGWIDQQGMAIGMRFDPVTGHSIYMQNGDAGFKYVLDNICFNSFGDGIEAYGKSAPLKNFVLKGNIAFNAGAAGGRGDAGAAVALRRRRPHLALGGGSAVANVEAVNNYTWHPMDKTGVGIKLGSEGGGNNGILFKGNYAAGCNHPLALYYWTGGSVVGNTSYGTAEDVIAAHGSAGSLTFRNNRYFGANFFVPIGDWNAWRTRDTGATFNQPAARPPDEAFLRVNRYSDAHDRKLAHVAIYNWSRAAGYALPVASVDKLGNDDDEGNSSRLADNGPLLLPGDRYEVRSAQNYFGPAVATGTYDGSGQINIPLTDTSVETPIGRTFTPPSSLPDFGVFIILKSASAGPVTNNTPPTLSALTNQTVAEDAVLGPLAITVGDNESAPASLFLSAASSNPSLVPVAGIVFGGSGASRTVTLQPAANQSGSATITLTVADGFGGSASRSLTVNVTPVNDAPTISNIGDQTISVGQAAPEAAFTVGDLETPPGSLLVTAASSNQALVPAANIVVGGSGANRTVRVTPAAGQSGSATLTLTVLDGQGGSASDSFVLNVTTNASGGGGGVVPTGGLVGWWKLDEASGTEAADSSGSGKPGTWRSNSDPFFTPRWTPAGGKVGGALELDGVDDYVEIGVFTMPASYTKAAWVKAMPQYDAAVNGHQIMSGDSRKYGQSHFLHALGGSADQYILGAGHNLNVSAVRDTQPMVLGQWYHVAVSYEAAGGTMKLYKDGALVASTSGLAQHTDNWLNLGTYGYHPGESHAQRWRGFIDDARIYNRVLSATEIAALAGGTAPPPNTPPTISAIADQGIAQGGTVGPISFTVGDAQTPVGSLTLTASSSNPTLVPVANVVFGGGGANRTVTVNPVASQSGSATITVTVLDGQGGTASDGFLVTVTPTPNTPPTLSDVADQTTSEDSVTAPLAITVGDAQTAAASLVMSAASSNPTLVPVANVVFGGSGASRTVTVRPAANQSGTATVTVTVADALGATTSDTFLLTVTPVNDPPVISSILDQSTRTNTPTSDIAFTVGDPDTAAGSLTVAASSSNPALVPDGNIALGGSGASRTIRVNPIPGQTGTAVITVTVSDGALSASDSFVLTVLNSEIPPASLAAHWKFDETAGAQAIDTLGAAHGTLVNGPLRVNGGVGGALDFDGVNDFVNVPDGTPLDLGANLTLAFWFQPAQLLNAASGRKDLLKKFLSYWLILNYPSGDGKLAFVINNGSSLVKSTTASWEPGRWYHVAATYDGASMKIYVNGALEGSAAVNAAVTQNNAPVQIGGNTDQGYYFAGMMDEVRLYSAALPVEHLQALFAVQTPTNPPTPPSLPPTLSPLADRSLDEDHVLGPLAFTIGDPDTALSRLVVAASSSNPDLAPPGRIVLGGSGANRTLTLTPGLNKSGNADITVSVSDGTNITHRTFALMVNPVNDPPTLSPCSDRTVPFGTTNVPVAFTLSDTETPASAITLTAASSNPALVTEADMSWNGEEGARMLLVNPQPGKAGSTVITVTAHDGDASTSRSFRFTVTGGVAGVTNGFAVLTTNGAGVIAPDLNGRPLVVGRAYTVTARPAPGHLFAGWSGATNASAPTLRFIMQPGLTLEARFVPNPFLAVKGTYQGLFHEAGAVRHDSSGAFGLTLGSPGSFTGWLTLAGNRRAFSGRFGLDGAATLSVARPRTNALTLTLNLDLTSGSDRVTGVLSDGQWQASLAGDRDVFHAVTNPAPQSGKFTLVLPGPDTDDGSPAGHSYGAVTISRAGDARLVGSLADGTPFAQSAPLAKDGHWPFYAPLYATRGSVLGWLGVTNRPDNAVDDITGLVSWIRPALPAARQYVSGFAHEAQAIGSAYVTPPGVTNRVIALTEGVAAFSGGPLENPLTCALALAANNRVTTLDSNKLALTFVKPSGLFTGSIRNPETGRTLPFRGAVLQNRSAGLGYFPGAVENGRVEIAPR